MAQFYTPYQQKKTTTGQQATPAPTGPNSAGGSTMDSYGGRSTIYHMLSDPGWSTGQTFQANSKIEALGALKGAQTKANPDDYAAMDELRNYYRQSLADLPGNTAGNISSFDTQSQHGLKNLLSQYKNANAGRGTMGSRQYAGAQGDIMSRANTDYMNGLRQARSDGLDQSVKLGAGLSMVQDQDLAERAFQNSQAKTYADLIANFMAQDQGRENRVDTIRESDFQKERGNIRDVLGSVFGGMSGSKKAKAAPEKSAGGGSSGAGDRGYYGGSVGGGMY